MRKIFIFMFVLISFSLIAQQNVDQYKYSDLISNDANGIYIWQEEIENITKYVTVNWRAFSNESKITLTPIYAVSTGDSHTVRGYSSDGFSVDKKEFLKWDRSKISEGIFVDSTGNRYLRVSKTNPFLGLDITIPVSKYYWKILKNKLVMQNDVGLIFTETGLLFNDENYDLFYQSGSIAPGAVSVFVHTNIDYIHDKAIISQNTKGMMIFYIGKFISRSWEPDIYLGELRLK